MRLRSITWKRDPVNFFGEVRPECWDCLVYLSERSAKIDESYGYRWNVRWP